MLTDEDLFLEASEGKGVLAEGTAEPGTQLETASGLWPGPLAQEGKRRKAPSREDRSAHGQQLPSKDEMFHNLSSSIQAEITKYRRPGLEHQTCISLSSESKVQDQGAGPHQALARTCFLPYRCARCVLTQPREVLPPPAQPVTRTLIHWVLGGPHPHDLVPPRAPPFLPSHWGLGLQPLNVGDTEFCPQHLRTYV